MSDTSSGETWSPIVDTHAHVFLRDHPLADNATHTPARSHTVEDYLAVLDAHSITYGVLTAPSFLGTYNDYTLEVLRRHRRLRGTAIVDPSIDPYTLRAMADDGIVGIRYSLRRYPEIPDLSRPEYQRLLRRVRDLDLFVHILAETERLAVLMPPLMKAGVKLVIDHFGVPEKPLEDDPGGREILRAIEGGRTWIKLSAPYRNTYPDLKGLARRFLSLAGTERLLWGSDWPWTANEGRFTYRDTIDWLVEWFPERDIRERIGRTGLELHRFA